MGDCTWPTGRLKSGSTVVDTADSEEDASGGGVATSVAAAAAAAAAGAACCSARSFVSILRIC